MARPPRHTPARILLPAVLIAWSPILTGAQTIEFVNDDKCSPCMGSDIG